MVYDPTAYRMEADRITKLRTDCNGRRGSYRVADERGYCDFTVWDGSDQLGSYGGTLWPYHFPDLFENLPSSPSLGSGRVRVTAQLPA